MQNGQDNQISINPQQAASFALDFMMRVPHTHAERERFDIGVGLLQAIATGQVALTQGTQPASTAAAAAPH